MSKKTKGNGGGFSNYAAQKFNDVKRIYMMSEDEIRGILDSEMSTMVDQMAKYRRHEKYAKYPDYISRCFVSLGAAKYFYEYVMEHTKIKKGKKKKLIVKTDLTLDQVDAIKAILADAYRQFTDSRNEQYQRYVQDQPLRLEYISCAFVRLDPINYNLTKKLKFEFEDRRRELCMQVYQDPSYTIDAISKLFNHAKTLQPKKLLKLVKTLYATSPVDGVVSKSGAEYSVEYTNRFVALVGATLTIHTNKSDFFDVIFDHVNDTKKRKRAKYIKAYGDAYKHRQSNNKRLVGDFYVDNKDIIKELVGREKKKHLDSYDITVKAAFDGLKPKKDKKASSKEVKEPVKRPVIKTGYEKPWESV